MLDEQGVPTGYGWGNSLGISMYHIATKLYPEFFSSRLSPRGKTAPRTAKSSNARRKTASSRASYSIITPTKDHEAALRNSWIDDMVDSHISGLTKLENTLNERYRKRDHNLRELLRNIREKE